MLSGKLSFHNYKILKKESALSEMSKCHMSKMNENNLQQEAQGLYAELFSFLFILNVVVIFIFL